MKKLPIILLAASAMVFSCKKESPKSSGTESETAQESEATKPQELTEEEQRRSSKVKSMKIDENSLKAFRKEAEKAAKVAETAEKTTDKPALNPPHGEPYHRCDIEVGAPLNSPAPVQSTPAPVVMPQRTQTNVGFDTNPIRPSSPSVQNSGPKPALNPPHGEPYHRCDLQVGAPLI